MDGHSQQIIDYIQHNLERGYSEPEIRSHLVSSGWSEAMVARAFSQFHNRSLAQSPVSPRPPAQPSPAAQQPAPSDQALDMAGPIKLDDEEEAPKQRKSSKRSIIIEVIAVLVALGLIAFYLMSMPKTAGKLSDKQRETTVAAEKSDVNKVAASVSNFIQAHNGSLPKKSDTDSTANTLDICGASCSDKVTVSLSYFKNTSIAVGFHVYATTLAVSDTQTMYIVTNATCNKTNTGIGAKSTNTTKASAAFLYALPAPSGLQQECQNL